MPERDLFDLSGRCAIVTGAGGIIGSAISKGLARQGATVVLVDVRQEELEASAAEVRALGEAHIVAGDISRPEGASAAVASILSAVDSVDILVNNVGTGSHTQPDELTFEEWSDILRINLTTTFLMSQEVGRHMLERGIRGSIVNTSSTCGGLAMGRGNFAYSIAKAGVNQLTRELALEWGPSGIRVNAIQPCQVDTPSVRAMLETLHPDGRPLGEHVLGGIPLGRLAQAEDMVGPIVFLASDASSMVTGVTLPVDGGNLSVNAAGTVPPPHRLQALAAAS